jgi:hypothetical protein
VKKVVSFDLDGTMCFTPEPEDGKKVYKKVTGQEWPHSGWWGRKESLDLDIFPIPVNPLVYSDYLKHKSDNESYIILATGRLDKLQNEVQKILDYNNLDFDEVHCNPGVDTYIFKTKLFERLIQQHRPEVFTMYDDRHEHLVKFGEWAKTQPCQIDIIDVVNKTHKIFNT